MISSNLSTVLGKFKRAQAELPERIATALDASKYVLIMRDIAHFAMENSGIFNDDERAQIPLIAERITATSGVNSMQFVLQVQSFDSFAGIGNINDDLKFDEAGNPDWTIAGDQPPKELVDWVRDYKEKDPARDAYRSGQKKGEWYSDERIAKRVMAAMKENPEPWFRTDIPGHGALNPTGVAAVAGLSGVPPEKLSKALLIVLYEWRRQMVEFLPDAVAIRIRLAFQ